GVDNTIKSWHSHFIMTNPMQMVKLIVRMARLVRRPDRLDDVIAVADQIRTRQAVEKIVAWVARDPEGARALEERPRIRIDMAELGALPPGAVGGRFTTTWVKTASTRRRCRGGRRRIRSPTPAPTSSRPTTSGTW